jgi:hypothetical protein
LFRNTGNANGWLELDLVGSASNRDGLGAKVFVTAGNIKQYREQNGGYHRWSQNYTRLHFGLGSNDYADIEVDWPSGLVEKYSRVSGRAIYRITEGQGISPR